MAARRVLHRFACKPAPARIVSSARTARKPALYYLSTPTPPHQSNQPSFQATYTPTNPNKVCRFLIWIWYSELRIEKTKRSRPAPAARANPNQSRKFRRRRLLIERRLVLCAQHVHGPGITRNGAPILVHGALRAVHSVLGVELATRSQLRQNQQPARTRPPGGKGIDPPAISPQACALCSEL